MPHSDLARPRGGRTRRPRRPTARGPRAVAPSPSYVVDRRGSCDRGAARPASTSQAATASSPWPRAPSPARGGEHDRAVGAEPAPTASGPASMLLPVRRAPRVAALAEARDRARAPADRHRARHAAELLVALHPADAARRPPRPRAPPARLRASKRRSKRAPSRSKPSVHAAAASSTVVRSPATRRRLPARTGPGRRTPPAVAADTTLARPRTAARAPLAPSAPSPIRARP